MVTKIKKLIIIIGFIMGLLCPCLVYAGGYGTAGAQILNLNGSAKIAAMGDANAGVADDLNAVISNPAGLIQVYGTELQLARVVYFLNTGMNVLTYGQRVGRVGMGLNLKFFSAEDTYRDSLGYGSKKFIIRYGQYTLGAGYSFLLRHSVGVSLNMVTENFRLGSTDGFDSDKKDSVMAFDVGWLYRGYRGDSFGAVIRNIGGEISPGEKKDRVPLKYVLGGGHILGKFLFAWEVFNSLQVSFGWKFGVQVDLHYMKLRCGCKYVIGPDMTIGFGLPYGMWLLDYAFFPHQDLGAAHRLSLGFWF